MQQHSYLTTGNNVHHHQQQQHNNLEKDSNEMLKEFLSVDAKSSFKKHAKSQQQHLENGNITTNQINAAVHQQQHDEYRSGIYEKAELKHHHHHYLPQMSGKSKNKIPLLFPYVLYIILIIIKYYVS